MNLLYDWDQHLDGAVALITSDYQDSRDLLTPTEIQDMGYING